MNSKIVKSNAEKIAASGIREVERYLGCPYCGQEQERRTRGCCGESSDHFENMYRFVDNGDEATYEDWLVFDAFLDTLPDPFLRESEKIA